MFFSDKEFLHQRHAPKIGETENQSDEIETENLSNASKFKNMWVFIIIGGPFSKTSKR